MVTSALRKKTIDSFVGAPADGVSPGDLTSGAPVNIYDPSEDPGAGTNYSLPPAIHFPDDEFLRPGDTIFEVLTLAGGVYEASLPVDFYRNVWFDGLSTRIIDHWTMTAAGNVDPETTLPSGVNVTAKYVMA